MSNKVKPGDVLYDDLKENNSITITLLKTNNVEASLVDLSTGLETNIIAKPDNVVPAEISEKMSREALFDAIHEKMKAESLRQFQEKESQKEQLKNTQIEKLKSLITHEQKDEQNKAKNIYLVNGSGLKKIIATLPSDEETLGACLPIFEDLAKKQKGTIIVVDANERMDTSEGVVLAYFESDSHAEFAGLFRNEWLYENCTSALEGVAKKANMFVTESVDPDEDTLENFYEDMGIAVSSQDDEVSIELNNAELSLIAGIPWEDNNLTPGLVKLSENGYKLGEAVNKISHRVRSVLLKNNITLEDDDKAFNSVESGMAETIEGLKDVTVYIASVDEEPEVLRSYDINPVQFLNDYKKNVVDELLNRSNLSHNQINHVIPLIRNEIEKLINANHQFDFGDEHVTKIEGELEDKSGEPFEKTQFSVEFVNGAVQIKAKGYGDNLSADNHGVPILIEQFNGELRVVAWGDINQEYATDIISLEGAKEINRESEFSHCFEK